MARISSKNQVALPVAILRQAGLGPGDEVIVEAEADGSLRLIPQRRVPDFKRFIGAVPMQITGEALLEELRGAETVAHDD